MSNNKVITLSVDVSPAMYALLDQMAEDSHSSKADILKKSVFFLQVAKEEQKNGNAIGVVKDNKILKEIVNL